MKAYLVVDLDVADPEVFSTYVGRIGALIEKHQGEYLVRGAPPTTVLARGDSPQHLVVIEFPSRRRAEAFLEERAAEGLSEIFARGTNSRILLADGA